MVPLPTASPQGGTLMRRSGATRLPAPAFSLSKTTRRRPPYAPSHNALVLVADGRKMLFFRNHGDEDRIDLRTEAHDARADRKDRELRTDAPGTVQQSFGF